MASGTPPSSGETPPCTLSFSPISSPPLSLFSSPLVSPVLSTHSFFLPPPFILTPPFLFSRLTAKEPLPVFSPACSAPVVQKRAGLAQANHDHCG